MIALITMTLLTLLAAITVAIIVQRSMFGVVILAGVYSFLMATVMLLLDAPDVAMTEASVGAGVSTVLLLSALHLCKPREMAPVGSVAIPLMVSLIIGAALIYGTPGLSKFGAENAAIHQHVAPYYLENSLRDMGVKNVVTTVLASYRAFDTLGEVTVVFAAGIGVMMLLRGAPRDPTPREDETDSDGGSGDETDADLAEREDDAAAGTTATTAAADTSTSSTGTTPPQSSGSP
ncbi:MAG: DUF4040 domain-containing protein [Pseudomonadota bacterium]